MRITNAGNVGIGLIVPSEKLEVSGTVKCTDLKFEYGGSTATLSTVGFITASSTNTLTNKPMTKNQMNNAARCSTRLCAPPAAGIAF